MTRIRAARMSRTKKGGGAAFRSGRASSTSTFNTDHACGVGDPVGAPSREFHRVNLEDNLIKSQRMQCRRKFVNLFVWMTWFVHVLALPAKRAMQLAVTAIGLADSDYLWHGRIAALLLLIKFLFSGCSPTKNRYTFMERLHIHFHISGNVYTRLKLVSGRREIKSYLRLLVFTFCNVF
jgi:hypothetical protein